MSLTLRLLALAGFILVRLHAGSAGVVMSRFELRPPPEARAGYFPFLWGCAPDGSFVAGNGDLVRFDAEGRSIAVLRPDFTIGFARDVALAAGGDIFVAGQITQPLAMTPESSIVRLLHLVKLRADGTRYQDFGAVWVSGAPLGDDLTGVGITRVAPDGAGGCFAAGRFDSVNGVAAADLVQIDRQGNVRPWLTRRVASVAEPWRLVPDGASLIVVGSEGLVRVVEVDEVQPFQRDDDVQWIRVHGAAFDARFGLAVIGEGRVGGGERDVFCAVYERDGTRRRSFVPSVRFDGTAGGGNAIAWDSQGRVIVGFVGGVRDPEETDGKLQHYSPLVGYALEGFPPVLFGVKRLLPDGRLDPAWSRAMWFERPTARLVVLPDDSVVVGGEFPRFAGGRGSARAVRLAGAPDPVRRVQQSARGHVGPGGPVLIMGLAIDEDVAVDVLVRAVGPSLGRFGVRTPVASTRFAVYEGERLLVRVGPQANTRPVVWASGIAGAFPLAAGALEAQALLSLSRGAYTVVIESGSGATAAGDVLGEIYFP